MALKKSEIYQMASFTSVSETELGRRRQKLQRQRQLKLAAAMWQTLAVSAMAGGLLWWVAQPAWLVARSDQVKVEGNQWLSDKAVRSLLPLSYPQSLWGIQPQVVAQKLEATGPIAKAKVTRNLFPPSLTVEVTERLPVAIAQPAAVLRNGDREKVGWLDARGGWMPFDSYTSDKKSIQASQSANGSQVQKPQGGLPTLKAIGPIELYRSQWPNFYQALSSVAVKVFEINWQNPDNLILKTEIGTVHLGPYSSRTTEQLKVLDRMRQLPRQIDLSKIAFIDLKNPAAPTVHMPEPVVSSDSSNSETTSTRD